MSSISDAIPIKSLQQSNVLLRILVKDFYLKIIFMEANWIELFLASGHILLKISSKDF